MRRVRHDKSDVKSQKVGIVFFSRRGIITTEPGVRFLLVQTLSLVLFMAGKVISLASARVTDSSHFNVEIVATVLKC